MYTSHKNDLSGYEANSNGINLEYSYKVNSQGNTEKFSDIQIQEDSQEFRRKKKCNC